MRFILGLAAIGLAATAVPASAVERFLFGYSPFGSQLLVTDSGSIQASEMGYFSGTGRHFSNNNNYVVGGDADEGFIFLNRNFFQFAVSGSFTSAQLQIGNRPAVPGPAGIKLNGLPSLTWTLYDVSQPLYTAPEYIGRTDIYDDLGSGAVFGEVTVTGDTDLITVTLNANGLAALNLAAAQSRPFTVGGSIIPGNYVPPFVPEPSTWAMLIAGFGLVGAAMRRRAITAVTD
jgi:hypothetical protein